MMWIEVIHLFLGESVLKYLGEKIPQLKSRTSKHSTGQDTQQQGGKKGKKKK